MHTYISIHMRNYFYTRKSPESSHFIHALNLRTLMKALQALTNTQIAFYSLPCMYFNTQN